MARIIAVANQKGGVGKTTTAINLAASLAVAERRVLAVDIDPQANLTSGLGRRGAPADASLYAVLAGERSLESIVLPTDLPHLWLAPAHRDLTGAEVELVGHEHREYGLRHALEPARDAYDYVLIDCPPSLGLLTLNGLVAADRVLVPLQCEYFALEGLAELMATLRRIRAALNPALALEGVLLTMVDERMNLTQQVAAEVREHFSDHVFRTGIPRSVRLGEAPSFGKPILAYDIRSKGAQAYLELAKEVIEREAESPRQGSFGPAA